MSDELNWDLDNTSDDSNFMYDSDDWGSSVIEEPPVNPNQSQSTQNQLNWGADDRPQVNMAQQPQQSNSSGGNAIKLGMKSTAIILAVVLAILAMFLLGIDKIHFSKKSNTEVEQTQSESGGTQDEFVNDGVSLQRISEDVVVDYTGEILQTSGTVHDKVKFLYDSQVIYCIEIALGVGDSQTVSHYYCGYNTYDSVSIGDTVTVDYQQVSDNCYSINTISK